MKQVNSILNEDSGFISTRGMSDSERRLVYEAAEDGGIYKIRNGVYATPDALADTMVDIEKVVPNGILCWWSAWSIYGLTTQIPNAYYVAIEAKRKVRLPSYPEFQLVYQANPRLSIGVTERDIEGYRVRIYDIERCVCDAIRLRNKIGIDVMAEILRTYLARPDRYISKLMSYAQPLRVANILNTYLEVWR